jgi:ArsR family transcriptional regulator
METLLQGIDPEKVEKVAFILKTIGHPVRLGIIDLLVHFDRLSVNDICEKLDQEQSLVSHHLSNMKLKGILGSTREGKNIYYYLKLQEVITVIECMSKCEI